MEEDNPSKNFRLYQELEGIDVDIVCDIDDIGNLQNLLRTVRIVFIHEKCGNLKVFVDDGELSRNIKNKKTRRRFISLQIL